jgi:hypothetical protein
MQISPEHAFRILERYRRNRKLLDLAGYLLGCQHACPARVTNVWPETRSVAIELFEGENGRHCECFVPLCDATFWSNHEVASFLLERTRNKEPDPVLRTVFSDGTTIAFTERRTPEEGGAPDPS